MKAFPHPSLTVSDMGQVRAYTVSEGGMDLRDYFAAQVLPALIINPTVNQAVFDVAEFNKKANETALSRMAYVIADAMMKTREQNDS